MGRGCKAPRVLHRMASWVVDLRFRDVEAASHVAEVVRCDNPDTAPGRLADNSHLPWARRRRGLLLEACRVPGCQARQAR